MAVLPSAQNKGIGQQLVQRIVEDLRAATENRVLLVETSSLLEFASSRAFYLRCGFEEECRIREFYARGEDKVVYRMTLS